MSKRERRETFDRKKVTRRKDQIEIIAGIGLAIHHSSRIHGSKDPEEKRSGSG